MKLTIIETGRPPEPVAADFPRYPVMVEALLAPHIDALECETISLIDGDLLPHQDDVQAIIIMGSPVGVYDAVDWIEPLKAWICDNAAASIPQVGICFGHQIIAAAFGGHVHKAPQGWGLGRHEYRVRATPTWSRQSVGQLSLAVSHQDQVLTPPESANVIAASDFTPYAALVYDHAPALTFQGHPEFCVNFTDALIRSRRGTRFSAEQADAALSSLQDPLDGQIAAAWIGEFYTHHLAQMPQVRNAKAA